MNKLEQIYGLEDKDASFSKFEELADKNIKSSLTYFNSLSYSLKSSIINKILSDLIKEYLPIAKGNSNLRISGTYIKEDLVCIFENCFGKNTLNSYRRLLDEIALYSVESDIDYKKITPIIIFATMPNKRVDMWATMSDIHNVLSIDFKIMTIMELWITKKLNITFDQVLKLSNYDHIKKGLTESDFLNMNDKTKKYQTIIKQLPILRPKK